METEDNAVLFNIVDALCRDQGAGVLRDLQHYQRCFPGYEEVVAREYLHTKHGRGTTPGASTPRALALEPDAGSMHERIRRLSEPIRRGARYSKEAEIGRGGMGVVHRVRDVELDRTLALKHMREDAFTCGPLYAARFLEEAQVTAQLDHPGIVPVHEAGVDDEGRLFFAMKLVRGRELRTILDLAERAEDGWSLARVLAVLLRVCEAMAYSHSKGVIHRDLKPGNIMVGHFGEVYVMDWGVARILESPDLHDLRIQDVVSSMNLRTVRLQERVESESPSPLLTMDGEVVGTPSYMSPEQARGELDRVSPRSDVYSIGAILYHALTGQAPFVPAGVRLTAHGVLWRLIDGPPAPSTEIRGDLPDELVAICDKAMAREPEQRYPDMGALATDLAAFLEQRVVRAYETGAWAEARKWVRRNKPLAATLAALVLLTLGALSGMGEVQARGRRAAERAQSLAQQERERADREAQAAIKKTDEVLRLSALQDVEDLLSRVDELWPAHPANRAAYESWIRQANALTADLPLHRSRRAELRARALPQSAEETRIEREGHPDHARWIELEDEIRRAIEVGTRATSDEAVHLAEEQLAVLEEERAALGRRIDERRNWTFPEAEYEARWWNNQLTKLIEELEGLQRELLAADRTTDEYGWSVPRRLALARSLEVGFAQAGPFERAWTAALPAIRASYPRLDLTPQMGLLPIGPDPESGLWEFAHLQTGEPAQRGSDGQLILAETTGLVLVLLPGGTFQMGAQNDEPTEGNYDPQAASDESPPHPVTLPAFFLSKHEMTQGQWLRFSGRKPSYLLTERLAPFLLPVEQVSWRSALQACDRLGLSLPSEAQWEYGARGGTASVWWSGDDPTSLIGAANLAERTPARMGASWSVSVDGPDLGDGSPGRAPVNRYSPNPFGLHDVHGNVWEWCRSESEDGHSRGGFSNDAAARSSVHPCRGGAFNTPAELARASNRSYFAADLADVGLGLRPARAITP